MAEPQQEKPKTLKDVLESARAQIAAVCPPHITPERVIRLALLAAHKNPNIARCSPASVVFSVIQIAAWGLEIGRTAHLVPFKDQCQPMPDFKGLVQMMIQSGEVMQVDGRVVREGDHFEVEYGMHERLEHRPVPANVGEIVAAYAILTMPSGSKKFDVMWRSEIEKVRASSRAKDSGPWRDWYDQMAIKTVLKRIAKQVPLSERVHEAIEADSAEYGADATDARPPAPASRGRSRRLAALAAPRPDPLEQFDRERSADEPVGQGGTH